MPIKTYIDSKRGVIPIAQLRDLISKKAESLFAVYFYKEKLIPLVIRSLIFIRDDRF